MKVITKQGKNNTIVEVDPDLTYFIAIYKDGVVKGTGLNVSGWDDLEHGIVRLSYALSTGQVVSIPQHNAYMHLIEVSESIDKEYRANGKNYHNVYIKGLDDSKIVVYKIALRGTSVKDIGKTEVYTEPVENYDMYKNAWKYGDK